MQKKSLEITCYVAGAGAFGVFLRWLQDQLAFDENGLSEPSVFNFLVPLMLLAAAWMFTRFINKIQDDKCYVPRDFCDALFNPGKLFAVARWAIGLLMCLGSVVLLMTSETDVDADFIRIICLLGFLSGLAFPFVLGSANYDEFANVRFVRLCMMMPILLFSAWLILCYKQNSYNSVVWSYDRDGDDHRRAAGVLPHRGLRFLRPELAQVHACDNDGRGNVHHVPCRRALYGDAHHYALRGAAHSV